VSTVDLLTPVFDGGIRSTNFFNGRILSGEDLTQEKEAHRETHKLLGRAIGDGIVSGLEVSKSAGAGATPVVEIAPGVAINREGQTVRLAGTVKLSLVRARSTVANGASAFAPCEPFQTGVYVAGTGVYLLTIAPAEGRQGRALVSGLEATDADCNAKYLVDGVQFRLTQLDATAAELNAEDRLRNVIAYKCFGAGALSSFVADPFGPALTSYGTLDALRPKRLGDCEVPLAVVHWTASEGIKFVDLWSVRRRVTEEADTDRWSPLIGRRRVREAEAMLLQFQDHVDSLRSMPNAAAVSARQHFDHLPPAGLLPIAARRQLGFVQTGFFAGCTVRAAVIEAARCEHLLRESFAYPPIETASKELIWIYLVRENQEPGTGSAATRQPYVIFARGDMPYRGDARLDVAHYDYGNYALASRPSDGTTLG
jgi:hypothetical protein